MSPSRSSEKGFLDHLSSPLTLLPMGAGLSLVIVAWALPVNKVLFIFLGGASFLAGLAVLVMQWLVFGEDSKLSGQRQEFTEALEAACHPGQRGQTQEARLAATPAPVER
jgi:hypothetical protein